MARRFGSSGLGDETFARKLGTLVERMPRQLVTELRRNMAKELADARRGMKPSEWPDATDRTELARYATAINAMNMILGFFSDLPGIRDIDRALEEAEREFMPAGPPTSPVHDSLFVTWSLLDLGIGRHRETVAMITGAMARSLKLDEDVVAGIEWLAGTRLGVFDVERRTAQRVGASAIHGVRELVTGIRSRLQFLDDYDVREGDLILARPAPLADELARQRGATHVAHPTPYVLGLTTEPEWLDYFQREAAELGQRLGPEVYARIMRGAGDEPRWMDFVVNGYSSIRDKGIVIVAGIPDRPETLPHHPDHDIQDSFVVPPRAPTRERALILSSRIAKRMYALAKSQPRSFGKALAQRFDALVAAGGTVESWQAVVMPVVFYETDPLGGPPLVDRLLERRAGGEPLDAEDIEYVEAVRRGFTSVFEVMAVRRGESMRLRDLLARGEYEVEERSGTMEMPTRVVVFARLFEYCGVWLADAMHPRPAEPSSRDRIVAQQPARPRSDPATVFDAMVAWQQALHEDDERRASAPLPRYVTTTGEPVAWSTAVFEFAPGDRERVLDAVSRLRRCVRVEGEDGSGDAFEILTPREMVEAQVTVGSGELTITSNAKERLDRVANRIRSHLRGKLVRRSLEVQSVEDLLEQAVPRVQQPPSPEIREVLVQVIREQYVRFLDEPIPALGGASPRQAARDPGLRARLDELLRDHEYHVTSEHGPDVIDFDAMRRQLGLEG